MVKEPQCLPEVLLTLGSFNIRSNKKGTTDV